MEAVAADAILVRQIQGDGVVGGPLGEGAVKGGVEGCHHGDARAQHRPRGPNRAQRRGVVQGSQVGQRLDGGQDLVVDERRLNEQVSTVDDPVADGVKATRRQESGGGQPVEHVTGRLGVVGHCGRPAEAFAALDGKVNGRPPPNAFHDSAGQSPPLPKCRSFRVDLDELELEGGASAVEDEDLHRSRKHQAIVREQRSRIQGLRS